MTSDFSVDMNEYLPLRDVVFNTLRQAILKGELKPGERLLEIALAERLGVSRTPVREAMRKLEQEGLVLIVEPCPPFFLSITLIIPGYFFSYCFATFNVLSFDPSLMQYAFQYG